jgi:hypothetical protein
MAEEDAPLPEWSMNMSQSTQEMTEADYVAAQEEYELQQLIASMEQENDATSQHFGSDDEDYDQLFMECVGTVDQQFQQQTQFPNYGFDDMDMDMTEG